MMKRDVWIVLSVLTILTAGLFVHAQGQQQGRIYPTGQFVLLWRNATTPQRFIEVNRERRRVHINYNNEEIEFSLIMRASDGNYYGFYNGTGTRTYPPTQGWVVAYSNIPLDDYSQLHTIVVRDYTRLPLNRRTPVQIGWYWFDGSRVDRETTRTATVSPPTYRRRDGMTFIRYYLVDIQRGSSGANSTNSRRLSSGGILAPIIHIRWTDSNGNQRSKWIGEPLPGKNDCTRWDGRTGTCIGGSQSNPVPGANYNQFYERREWNYSLYFLADIINLRYPVCYPVYVFRNLGALHDSGHSDSGLSSATPIYNVAYGTARWQRVHRATIWENVPYEWGGKFYGACASGVRHGGRRDNGTGTSLGFGLDCSGLVAVAKGDYGNTNYGTHAIVNETTWLGETRRGERIPHWHRLRPGDVIIRPGVHVMLVCRTYYNTVLVIEAVGSRESGPQEKVIYSRRAFGWLENNGYEPRAFND